MKSIYFLSLNALQFVPYAYGLLQSFARQDPCITDNYTWQEPLTRIEAVGTTTEKINSPDILCASCYVWNNNQQLAIAKREEFGLKTKIKSLRIPAENCEKETVEIVFETNTMPYDDWAYCFLLGEMIQALHNGAYTRHTAIYLNDTGQMSYKHFYNHLLTSMLRSNKKSHAAFNRVKVLIDAYYQDPHMPQIHKILSQPDMVSFLSSYNPKRKGWHLWTYLWLSIGETSDDFYATLREFLIQEGIRVDKKIGDLLRYQKELMLALDYDPAQGKDVTYQFYWFDYFFNGNPLQLTTLCYSDTYMGITNRYQLEKDNRFKFVNAAIGISYPYTKFRHFFHQPDQTETH